ncbi:MAG TPA: DUF4304 domain-containing protein [Thermoflexales bacterium]|nr:DUF4304 domain-containing protein [Thermoflexales bacterium]HQW36469.1 DUF4304 domain-containing protein [Thermoflexales bacterium]
MNQLINSYLGKDLRKLGFWGRGMTKNRIESETIQVIHFQTAPPNQKGKGSFTINIGVAIPKILSAYVKQIPHTVRDVDCVLSKRLSNSDDDQFDTWWNFTPDTQLSIMASQVYERILKDGLRFFDKYKTLHDVFLGQQELLASGKAVPLDFINYALVAFYEGEHDIAWKTLDKPFTKNKDTYDFWLPIINKAKDLLMKQEQIRL